MQWGCSYGCTIFVSNMICSFCRYKIILIINLFNRHCKTCPSYYRDIMVYNWTIPSCLAFIAVISLPYGGRPSTCKLCLYLPLLNIFYCYFSAYIAHINYNFEKLNVYKTKNFLWLMNFYIYNLAVTEITDTQTNDSSSDQSRKPTIEKGQEALPSHAINLW